MPILDIYTSDDVLVHKYLGEWYFTPECLFNSVGWYNDQNTNMGSGLRFCNVTIPQGSTINIAYLTFQCKEEDDAIVVRSKIVGEATDDAAVFPTLANYQARRGTEVGGANNNNRTVAEVLWDNIGAWVVGEYYDSPEIKTIIQEIVNRAGWVFDNSMVIWWDDHAGRSDNVTIRTVRYAELGVHLHIEYTPPPSPRATQPIKDIVTLEALRNIEMSATGRLYVNEEGKFVYESRYGRNP